jgi:DNA repair exonuclease SbcCD nuclease subunit
VIKIERLDWDAYSGEPIVQRDPFIECLTHDCLVVCIKALKDKRRNELEALFFYAPLLSIFDQSQAGADAHFLELKQGEIPTKYLPIMQRLHMATHEPELMEQMLYEDMLISEMEDYIRMQVEHELARTLEALKKADEYFHLAQQSNNEKVALEQEKEELSKKNEELNKRFSTIARVLFNEGKDLETISLMMNLSVDSVKNILDQGE